MAVKMVFYSIAAHKMRNNAGSILNVLTTNDFVINVTSILHSDRV